MIKRNLGPLLLAAGVVVYLVLAYAVPRGPFEYPLLLLVAFALVIAGAVMTVTALVRRRRRATVR